MSDDTQHIRYMENENETLEPSKTSSPPSTKTLKTVLTEHLDQAFWLGYMLRGSVNRVGSTKHAEQINNASRAIAGAIIEDMEYAYPEFRNLWARVMEEAENDPRLEITGGFWK